MRPGAVAGPTPSSRVAVSWPLWPACQSQQARAEAPSLAEVHALFGFALGFTSCPSVSGPHPRARVHLSSCALGLLWAVPVSQSFLGGMALKRTARQPSACPSARV